MRSERHSRIKSICAGNQDKPPQTFPDQIAADCAQQGTHFHFHHGCHSDTKQVPKPLFERVTMPAEEH